MPSGEQYGGLQPTTPATPLLPGSGTLGSTRHVKQEVRASQSDPDARRKHARSVVKAGSDSNLYRFQYLDFIRKIQVCANLPGGLLFPPVQTNGVDSQQARFPTGTRAEEFRKLMRPDRRTGHLTPALQLKPRVKKLYKGMMPVFDRYRQIATPNIQPSPTPQPLDRGKMETPRIKTEPGTGPYSTPVPARQYITASYGAGTPPVPGPSGRAALSPGSPNQIKKEEPLDIKRFSLREALSLSPVATALCGCTLLANAFSLDISSGEPSVTLRSAWEGC